MTCQQCGGTKTHLQASICWQWVVCDNCNYLISWVWPDNKKVTNNLNNKKMANEQVFPKGIRCFNPAASAPDFVIGSMVISLNELFQFCQENPALLSDYKDQKQLKLQLLSSSKEGKLYCAVDAYKAETSRPAKPPVTAAQPAATAQPTTFSGALDKLPF